MIQLSPALQSALNAAANQPVDLYELYLDSGTLFYSTEAITWGGNDYLPYVNSRSAIRRFEGAEFDRVTVTLANVDTALAQVLVAEEIEGRRLVVRKIDRTVSDDSIVLFHGIMERVSKIDETTATVTATQILGSIDHEAPARRFSTFCPWQFKSDECGYVGPETECNKSWARCNQLGRTNHFGGFRFIPHSGIFQYTETQSKRTWYTLGLWSRKKTKTITSAFNSVDDTPYDVPIPIVLGRTQIAGIVIQHADEGGVLKALAAFCVGTTAEVSFVRTNGQLVADWTQHNGYQGGENTQLVDPRFPSSYPYHILCYVGVTVPSDVQQVDSAPTIDAVVKGSIIDTYDAAGNYSGYGWTDNPVWNTRHFMTLPLHQGGMGIPNSWIDDAVTVESAAYCDELVTDTTNSQTIFEPTSLPAGVVVGDQYRRYQSTGVDGQDPLIDGPYEIYQPGVNDDTSVTPAPVQVKRFTLNCAIAKLEKAVDILYKKLLPAFRGYITFSKTGKIQIRVERPVPNTAIAAAVSAGATHIPVAATPFSAGDQVLVGVLTPRAEVLTVLSAAGGILEFTAATEYPHDAGEAIHRVAMSFDDSNMLGSIEYPLSDRQSSANRITVKYVDAPAGFEARALEVNDYEHQDKVHKVNNEDVDGSAIDNYFQAWRIGQWKRAKARDLGKFCTLKADIKASVLEVGDVIAVSAGETGLQAVPFRVIEIGFDENDEVSITGQLYSLSIYDDAAPQATVTVPSVFAPTLATTPTDVPIGDVTGVSAITEILKDSVSVKVSATCPIDDKFAGLEVFLAIPRGDDPAPSNPTAPMDLYPQGWFYAAPSTALQNSTIDVQLSLPVPPIEYLQSFSSPVIKWIVYLLPRGWSWTNELKLLTDVGGLLPADHTPIAPVTLDFTAFLGGLSSNDLGSVTLSGNPTATAGSSGLDISQDYAPPYFGIPGAFSIGSFEGIQAIVEYPDGKTVDCGSHPYTKDPYANPPANIETLRVTCPMPAALPATLYLHMMSYSPQERQKFKKVWNDGVATVHAQYAIAVVTVTSGATTVPVPTISGVTVEYRDIPGSAAKEYHLAISLSNVPSVVSYGGTTFDLQDVSTGSWRYAFQRHLAGAAAAPVLDGDWWTIQPGESRDYKVKGWAYLASDPNQRASTNEVTVTVSLSLDSVVPPVSQTGFSLSITEYSGGMGGDPHAKIVGAFTMPSGVDLVSGYVCEKAYGYSGTPLFSDYTGEFTTSTGSFELWKRRPPAGARVFVLLTSANAANGVWRPVDGTCPVAYVDLDPWTALASPTGCSVTVTNAHVIDGTDYFDLAISFTPPANQDYWYMAVGRIPRLNSNYDPVNGETFEKHGDYGEIGSFTVKDYKAPKTAEYWTYRFRPVNWQGVPNDAAAVYVNVTFPAAGGIDLAAAKATSLNGMEVVNGKLQPKLGTEFVLDANGKLTQQTVDMLKAAGFDTSLFEVSGGVFTQKAIATNLLVAAMAIITSSLRVGGGSAYVLIYPTGRIEVVGDGGSMVIEGGDINMTGNLRALTGCNVRGLLSHETSTGFSNFAVTDTGAHFYVPITFHASVSGVTVDYANVQNKPASFPPSAHSHGDADITGLSWSKLSSVPATFPPSAHTHNYASPTHNHSVTITLTKTWEAVQGADLVWHTCLTEVTASASCSGPTENM